MKTTDMPAGMGIIGDGAFSNDELIRQGSGACDVCNSTGILHEGQAEVVWKSNKIKVTKGGKVKRVSRMASRPAIQGEACPSCFGLKYGHEVENQEERARTMSVSQQIDRDCEEMLKSTPGAHQRLHRQVSGAATWNTNGQQVNQQRRRPVVRGGMATQKTGDGYVEFSFGKK